MVTMGGNTGLLKGVLHCLVTVPLIERVLIVKVQLFSGIFASDVEQCLGRLVITFNIAIQQRNIQTVKRRFDASDAARPKIQLISAVAMLLPLGIAAQKHRYHRALSRGGGEGTVVVNTQVTAQPYQLMFHTLTCHRGLLRHKKMAGRHMGERPG